MINLLNSLTKCSFVKKLGSIKCKSGARSIHRYNFDTNEEIIDNYLGNVMMIGINLPDRKNVLTETAVEKLCERVKYFEKSDELSVAVLHGIGGNFCTGIELTDKTVERGRHLMETLNGVMKPIIGSLSGYTTNFGFHLAIMCDILVMDETAVAGFSDKHQRIELFDFILQRLLLTVGLSKTMELISLWGVWPAKQCFESNLVNRIVTCGCSLGQALSWAQNIAKDPVDVIKEEKSKVISVLRNITAK